MAIKFYPTAQLYISLLNFSTTIVTYPGIVMDITSHTHTHTWFGNPQQDTTHTAVRANTICDETTVNGERKPANLLLNLRPKARFIPTVLFSHQSTGILLPVSLRLNLGESIRACTYVITVQQPHESNS